MKIDMCVNRNKILGLDKMIRMNEWMMNEIRGELKIKIEKEMVVRKKDSVRIGEYVD